MALMNQVRPCSLQVCLLQKEVMMNRILSIAHPELSHTGKRVLIGQYLERCSGKKTAYAFSVNANQLEISPAFKSMEAYDRVKAGLMDILNDMCDELDSQGQGCTDHYNCCDCGGADCGCRYCFSCNACQKCRDID